MDIARPALKIYAQLRLNRAGPRSMRASLFWLLASVSVFAVLAISLSIYAFTYRAEQEAWRGRQGEAARNAALQVASIFQRADDSLTLVGAQEEANIKQFPDLLYDYVYENVDLLEVVRFDNSGKAIADSYKEDAVLSNLSTIPQDQWFLQARSGKNYYGKFINPVDNQPYLLIAQHTSGGGVVAARLSMGILWKAVRDIHFGQAGKAYVVLPSGDVIAHTDSQVMLDSTNLRGRPEFEASVHAADHEWSGVYTSFEGQAVVGVTAVVAGPNWIIFTELPQNEAFATSRAAFVYISSVLFVIVILGIWLVMHSLNNLVVAPMRQLRDGAERIGRGDLDFRIGLQRQDEIGQVSAAFDQMAQNLQQRTTELAASRDGLVSINSQLAAANQELEAEIERRRSIEKQLQHDAFHDALTGLPNRALFIDRLKHAIERYRRFADRPFAVLFLDLDRFKIINDSLGHGTGDRVLIEISRRLQLLLRGTDTVARLGGDEFVILLEELKDLDNVIPVAERILIESKFPFHMHDHEMVITTSIGIVLSTRGYEDPEEVLRDADIALYRAKGLGRSRYAVFDDSLRTYAITRLEMENELRSALERKELVVYYQPIQSLLTNRITGFEALLRWNSPSRGLVSPVEFIPIAEETGLIVPIGEWVLNQVCRQLAVWQKQFVSDPPLSVNVNLSGVQLTHPHLFEQVVRALSTSGLDPKFLKLEITESVLMDNADFAQQVLTRLRDLGTQIQIDDFGTGYSSLAYLQRFPIHTIKIDRSFIARIGIAANGGANGSEIVKTIVSLARDLGMDTVAEGIETEDQLAQLKTLDCHYGQGFLIARPIDAEAVSGLLTNTGF